MTYIEMTPEQLNERLERLAKKGWLVVSKRHLEPEEIPIDRKAKAIFGERA